MCNDCSWKLVAPWWRWTKVGESGPAPRATVPVVQKYDTSDPVSLFVKTPQRALAYGDDDLVQQLEEGGAPSGRLGRFSAAVLRATTTRKVFLPSHKRFYLVVCELHCDEPGFPSVSRERVAQVGMVVRRRRVSIGAADAGRAAELLGRIDELSAGLARLERGVEKRLLARRQRFTPTGVVGGTAQVVRSRVHTAVAGAAQVERERLTEELATARAELLGWQAASGVRVVSEGWIPGDFQNVGAWRVVPDELETVDEVVYPMFPLVADPRDPGHDAAGRSIWFGLLPTGSREVDTGGAARFDDDSRYEVRCFARRRCECGGDGCGEKLFWSGPTEVFQLASHFDPVGTGNHPVTIQMPDLPALAASPAKLPVQMKFPKGSALNFKVEDGDATDPTTNTVPQICFFSIPLITIVATFVLNLFLPIVVFLFQLWFLLGLKFCIPPSLKLGAGAAVDASVQAKLEVEAQLDAQLQAAIVATSGENRSDALAAELNLTLTGAVGAFLDEDTHDVTLTDPTAPGARMRERYADSVLEAVHAAAAAGGLGADDAGATPGALAWVPRVERWEVAA